VVLRITKAESRFVHHIVVEVIENAVIARGGRAVVVGCRFLRRLVPLLMVIRCLGAVSRSEQSPGYVRGKHCGSRVIAPESLRVEQGNIDSFRAHVTMAQHEVEVLLADVIGEGGHRFYSRDYAVLPQA
jgi:hypothetical protein